MCASDHQQQQRNVTQQKSGSWELPPRRTFGGSGTACSAESELGSDASNNLSLICHCGIPVFLNGLIGALLSMFVVVGQSPQKVIV